MLKGNRHSFYSLSFFIEGRGKGGGRGGGDGGGDFFHHVNDILKVTTTPREKNTVNRRGLVPQRKVSIFLEPDAHFLFRLLSFLLSSCRDFG